MTDDTTGITRSQDAPMLSHLPFPVVGIGASAGGMLALRHFLEHLNAKSGMAYVVILHLSPMHESNADRVLQRSTRMRVVQVVEPTRIEFDHVYVISPSAELRMNDGVLVLRELERPRGRHVAIDHFFRTLAEAHQDRAIGIVMSGAGADGTQGLAKIKEQGGVTFAQTPEDAGYEDMPRNAIASGRVDFVLPAADMPARLAQLWENARNIRLPAASADGSTVVPTPVDSNEQSERALRDILEVLHARSGHDFRHYKRATVLRRIERRMQVNMVRDLVAYRDVLRSVPEEPKALLDDLLIGVTHFFRDREAFEAVERDVIPALFAERAEGDVPRVWVAGCSSGEEAYSLAILLADHADSMVSPPGYQVFASDIDEHALAIGRAGVYPEAILTDVPPARLRQFFTREQGHYCIVKAVRDRVLFALHNVLRDPPFSRVDLISCRNLLIYLDRDIQARVLEMFHFALRPGGLLFLGSSESADVASQYFEVLDKRNRIFRARAQARGTRHMGLLPLRATELRPVPELPRHAPDRRGFSFADVHQRVLEYYAPPSVVVDQDSNIVHLSPHAGRFLQLGGGEPSTSLIQLIDPALRLEVRTTLYQALHTKSAAESRVQIDDAGGSRVVRLSALPFRDAEASADFVLVIFDESENPGPVQPRPEQGERSDVLLHLENELQRTKDRLQATIEQSETSNEELKASNEELQAINEELRSATEELETSKEELQSVNEELITVNFELKTKVEETAKINDDLQNFIGATDIATVFVDAGLRIKRYTPRAEFIFNMIPTDIGRCLLDITHRLDYPDLADDAATAFETLQLIEREIRSTDGKWYSVRVLPYRTADNKIDGAVLTFIDTSSIRGNGDGNGAAPSPDGGREPVIVLADAQRRITAWSPAAAELFGYSDAEMLGRTLDDLYEPEQVDAGVPARDVADSSDQRRHEPRWFVSKRGDRIACAMFIASIGDGVVLALRPLLPGEPASIQRPVPARSPAEAVALLRDEFLAVMSHELKNPLNLISVNAELLARQSDLRESPVGAGAIETIRRAVRSQSKIIDDLLDMSRIRTGKLTLNPEPVDIGVLVSELVEIARLDALSRGIELRVQVPDTTVMVRGDAARLEQIAWNLISNAMKFTSSGGSVALSVGIEENYVRMRVRDTGRGIDPAYLPRIFDLFSQVPTRMPGRTPGGLGIGLTLVKQLVELHSGRVEVQSEGIGRGATFTVWLPRFTYQLHAIAEADGATAIDLDGLRFLLVDDDTDTANALMMLLETDGATVAIATSGQEALRKLTDGVYDVIVSDIGMPEMDGFELAHIVKSSPGGQNAPLIALSGHARPDDVQRADRAGFDLHLGKPLSLDALYRALADLRQAGRLR